MCDDGIDFGNLQQEFNTAKEADQKYSRENEAKFRAVHQKVASYDEFRDIVTASHLRPLDRDEIIGVKSTPQPWNTVLTSSSHDKHEEEEEANVPRDGLKRVSTLIKTRDEFMKGWSSTDNKIGFLLSFDIQFVNFVFKCDIPFNFLETMIEALLSDMPSSDYLHKVVDVFYTFTRCERFGLSVQFLSKNDKANMKRLFQKMEKSGFSMDDLRNLYSLK